MPLPDAHTSSGGGGARSGPTVSVVLPTFNRARWLKLAVDSVLAQTFTDWELVIADDGSDTETKAFLHGLEDGPNVRVCWLAHSGNPSLVRNSALREARGRFVAFLDSDDLWSPRKLEAQLAALESAPHCRWSYTACRRIDAEGDLLPRALQPTVRVQSGWIFEPLLTLAVSVAMPTVVAERTLIEEVGGFDEQQLYGEFHDLCLRLALRSEAVALPDVLCAVRAHAEHYSADRHAAHRHWMRLYEKFCALAPTARSRERSAWMRARAALDLAAIQAQRRDIRGIWRTLRAGEALSWRHRSLWHRCALALLRPFVPDALKSARRRQARRPV